MIRRDTITKLLACGVAFIVGFMVAMVIAVANPRTEETITCPPILEGAIDVDITAYYPGMPPDLTDADREFAELCGLEWGDPHLIEPPESGA